MANLNTERVEKIIVSPNTHKKLGNVSGESKWIIETEKELPDLGLE